MPWPQSSPTSATVLRLATGQHSMTVSSLSTMKPRALFLLASSSFLFAVACQGSSSDPAPAASASAAKGVHTLPAPPPESSTPLPPPFTGAPTVELVQSAKGSLPAPKPLREALGDLEAKLGPPTRTRQGTTIGPKRTWYDWAAANATTCATYGAVEQPNMLPSWPSKLVDDHAKSVAIPAHVIDDPAKGGGSSGYADWRDVAECYEVMGKKMPLPPDDPKGKGPGATITHAALKQGLYLAPSRWIGKTVTVRGRLQGAWGTILRIEAAGETEKGATIDCKVPAGEKAVGLTKDPVATTVTGVVADPRERVDGDVGELVDCTPAK